MINLEELDICRRRGHSRVLGEGWSQCESCGWWRRELRTIEEREDEPQESEMDTSRPEIPGTVAPNPAELLICRRRGHGHTIRSRWSRCESCGYWLREHRSIEER